MREVLRRNKYENALNKDDWKDDVDPKTRNGHQKDKRPKSWTGGRNGKAYAADGYDANGSWAAGAYSNPQDGGTQRPRSKSRGGGKKSEPCLAGFAAAEPAKGKGKGSG